MAGSNDDAPVSRECADVEESGRRGSDADVDDIATDGLQRRGDGPDEHGAGGT
jgi:hypothetical protein